LYDGNSWERNNGKQRGLKKNAKGEIMAYQGRSRIVTKIHNIESEKGRTEGRKFLTKGPGPPEIRRGVM